MAKEKFTTTDLPNNPIGEISFAGHASTITLDSSDGTQGGHHDIARHTANWRYINSFTATERQTHLDTAQEAIAKIGEDIAVWGVSKESQETPTEETLRPALILQGSSTIAGMVGTDGEYDLAMQRYYARTTAAEREAHLDTINNVTVDETPAEGVMQQELILSGSTTVIMPWDITGEPCQEYFIRINAAERKAHAEQASKEAANILETATTNPIDADAPMTEPLGAVDHSISRVSAKGRASDKLNSGRTFDIKHFVKLLENLGTALENLDAKKASEEAVNITTSAAANQIDSDTLATEPLGEALDNGSTEG